jgi:hypothetical protein
VILQDAALLMDLYQDCYVFKEAVFKSQEFTEFKSKVNSTLAATVEPNDKKLDDCVPILAEKLNDIKDTNMITTNLIIQLSSDLGQAIKDLGHQLKVTHKEEGLRLKDQLSDAFIGFANVISSKSSGAVADEIDEMDDMVSNADELTM